MGAVICNDSPTRLQKQEDHHYLRVRVQLLQCIRQAATKWHSNSTDSVLLQNSQIASDLTSQSPKLVKRPEKRQCFHHSLTPQITISKDVPKGPLSFTPRHNALWREFLAALLHAIFKRSAHMVIALGEGATQYDQRPGAWGSQEMSRDYVHATAGSE